MNRPLFLTTLLLSLSIVFSPSLLPKAQAKPLSRKAVAQKRFPIETKMSRGLFGFLGSNMDYSMQGKKFNSYKDFEDVIYPLRDPEASKLIHDARESELVWWILIVGGVAAGVDVAVLYKPVPFINIDFIDRIASGAVALQIILIPAIVFSSLADSDKFNAVQRYNHLVRGEEMTNLKITPQLFAGRDYLGLGLNGGF